jgi:hypothetical protein
LPRVPHQVLEQGKFARAKLDRGTARVTFRVSRIQREVFNRQGGRLGRATGAANQRLHARGSSANANGFVGNHHRPPAGRGRGGRRPIAARSGSAPASIDRAPPQFVDDAQSIPPRQHQIHDRDVRIVLEGGGQPSLAVARNVHRKPASRRPRDELSNGGIVFDDQGVHWFAKPSKLGIQN